MKKKSMGSLETLLLASASALLAVPPDGDMPNSARNFPASQPVLRLGSCPIRHSARAVLLTRDKTLISGGRDGYIRFWQIDSGRETRAAIKFCENTFQASTSAAAFSHDGQLFAAAIDSVITFHCLRQGEPAELTLPRGSGASLSFSYDRKYLAVGSWDSDVFVVEVESRKILANLKGHKGRVTCAAFSSDGKWLATGAEDGKVIIWNTVRWEKAQACTPNGHQITCVQFCSDAERFAFGSLDGSFYVWKIGAVSAMQKFVKVHQSGVRAIAFSPDQKLLVSAGGYGGQPIRVWDLRTGNELVNKRLLPHHIHSLVFSVDGSRLVVVGDFIRILRVPGFADCIPLVGHESNVTAICYSPDEKLIVTGGHDSTIRVKTGQEIRHFQNHTAPITCLSFSPDGGTLVSAATDGSVCFSDPLSGKVLTAMRQAYSARTMAFSEDGRYLALGCINGHLWILDSRARRHLHFLHVAEWPWRVGVAFLPGSTKVLTRAANALSLWDARLGKKLADLEDDLQSSALLSRSIDRSRFLTPGKEDKLLIWEPEGRKGCLVIKQEGFLSPTGLSADGRLAFISDVMKDRRIVFYEVASGKALHIHEEDGADPFSFVAFSPTNRFVCIGRTGNEVHIWDILEMTKAKRAEGRQNMSGSVNDLWEDLVNPDPCVAFSAIGKLKRSKQTIPFLMLKSRWKKFLDIEGVDRLVSELEAKDFYVRDRAQKALAQQAELSELYLRKVLREKVTLEGKRRLERLLGKEEFCFHTPLALQMIRGISVLEYIGSFEAEKILEQLASGTLETAIRREAHMATKRMRASRIAE